MRPLLIPGDSPWRIKAIIGLLTVFYLWARFFMPSDPVVLETLSMQAEVVSDSTSVVDSDSSVRSKLVKLRLPDGMHAFVTWRDEQPNQGVLVDVLVKVLDDGTRRVSLPPF